jgi:hypothetical protein
MKTKQLINWYMNEKNGFGSEELINETGIKEFKEEFW